MQIAQVIIQRNTWQHYRFVEKNFLHLETSKPSRFKMEGGLYHNFFYSNQFTPGHTSLPRPGQHLG